MRLTLDLNTMLEELAEQPSRGVLREDWRPMRGWEGRYLVSDLGRVFSIRGRRSKMLTPRFRGRPRAPYLAITIDQRTVSVHRLVLEAFVGPCPPGHEAAHLNGESRDPRLLNLAWVTHVENMSHQRIHGTAPTGNRNGAHTRPERRRKGGANGWARLTEADIPIIRSRVAVGESRTAVARSYSMSASAINQIIIGKSWGHVRPSMEACAQ